MKLPSLVQDIDDVRKAFGGGAVDVAVSKSAVSKRMLLPPRATESTAQPTPAVEAPSKPKPSGELKLSFQVLLLLLLLPHFVQMPVCVM